MTALAGSVLKRSQASEEDADRVMQLHSSQPRKQQPGGNTPGGRSPGNGVPSNDGTPPFQTIPIPSPQVIGELMVIAQRIGGDFRMSVCVGNPGEGSFFNPETCEITLDPVHIVHSPLFAKFVAGHEGSHRAITLKLTDLGMSEEEATFFLSHIGFHAGFNGCEDNAVNTWMIKVFPGMEGPVKAVYNEMFCRPNVEVQLPAIELAREQLGRYPRFGHYISEIIRDWHTGSFSPNLDPEVERVLKHTIRSVRKYTGETPGEHASHSDKIVSMQRRMEIYRHDVWPELQKLVELDLKNEEEHQLLKDILKLKEELRELKQEKAGTFQRGDRYSEAQRHKRIAEIEAKLSEIDKLGGGELLKLDAKLEKMIREAAERLAKQYDKLTEELEAAEARVCQLDQQRHALQRQLLQVKDPELRAKLQQKLAENQKELAEAQRALHEAARKLEAMQASGQGGGGAGGGMAIDMSQLSPETQKALRKLFQRLPQSNQQQMRGRAEQALRRFDDQVAKDLEGKLNEGNPSHADREPRSPQPRNWSAYEQHMRQALENFEIPRERMSESRRSQKTSDSSPWMRAMQVVGDQVTPLYLRLKRFLRPQEDPAWEPDFASGGRLNLDRVMQSEADPRALDRIWERRGVPRAFDYRFSFLVDISGSMQGEKAEETFKGLVVLAEVLERLEIPYEIGCFGSFFCNLKAFTEKLTDRGRVATAQSLLSNGGGTMDAWALDRTYKRMCANLGKDNFIVVMTDGESGMPGDLAAVINRIKKEKQVKLLALGLGPYTDFVKNSYPHAVGNVEMRLSDQQRAKGALEFLDVVTILLEDMVVNPGSYDA